MSLWSDSGSTPHGALDRKPNRQWQWWFPRGTDLADVDPDHADHVAGIINGLRRPSLDYHSPATLYTAAAVQ